MKEPTPDMNHFDALTELQQSAHRIGGYIEQLNAKIESVRQELAGLAGERVRNSARLESINKTILDLSRR
jgi:hypothetical protein